ncbi:hypothetical protein HMPREF3198_01401 [Winkia neuii]|nr:hypothetical protein HMPREF3198_01401 [Winkia neuii]
MICAQIVGLGGRFRSQGSQHGGRAVVVECQSSYSRAVAGGFEAGANRSHKCRLPVLTQFGRLAAPPRGKLLQPTLISYRTPKRAYSPHISRIRIPKLDKPTVIRNFELYFF